MFADTAVFSVCKSTPSTVPVTVMFPVTSRPESTFKLPLKVPVPDE